MCVGETGPSDQLASKFLLPPGSWLHPVDKTHLALWPSGRAFAIKGTLQVARWLHPECLIYLPCDRLMWGNFLLLGICCSWSNLLRNFNVVRFLCEGLRGGASGSLWLWNKYRLCVQPWISSVCLIKKSGVRTRASPQGQWNGITWKLPSPRAYSCLPEANAKQLTDILTTVFAFHYS